MSAAGRRTAPQRRGVSLCPLVRNSRDVVQIAPRVRLPRAETAHERRKVCLPLQCSVHAGTLFAAAQQGSKQGRRACRIGRRPGPRAGRLFWPADQSVPSLGAAPLSAAAVPPIGVALAGTIVLALAAINSPLPSSCLLLPLFSFIYYSIAPLVRLSFPFLPHFGTFGTFGTSALSGLVVSAWFCLVLPSSASF